MKNDNQTNLISSPDFEASNIDKSELDLLSAISSLIEQSRRAIYSHAASSTMFLFWNIGKCINENILKNKRADYGKKIVSMLSTQLREKYGSSFATRNLRRMMQFTEQFPDIEIVSPLATQLSWSHVIEILPLATHDAKHRKRAGRAGVFEA
jgi:hypothetical protein